MEILVSARETLWAQHRAMLPAPVGSHIQGDGPLMDGRHVLEYQPLCDFGRSQATHGFKHGGLGRAGFDGR